jgi:hypothetical protein
MLKERHHLRDPDVDGVILESAASDWINLVAQNMDKWQTFVNKAIYFQVPCNAKNSLTSWIAISFSSRALLHAVSNRWPNRIKTVTHTTCAYSETRHTFHNLFAAQVKNNSVTTPIQILKRWVKQCLTTYRYETNTLSS